MSGGKVLDFAILQDKKVLVTGASRGIGREIALALAGHGCQLWLHSRQLEHTRELVALLAGRGVVAHALAADLADPEAAAAMAGQAEQESGGIDLVFNNAAIMTPWRPDCAAPVQDYLASFAVNVISPIKICEVLLPGMLRRGYGRIVNTTSGIQDQPELLPYAVSKAALDKYVRDMAGRLAGSNVLMNLLDPGWIKTDLGGPQAPNELGSVIPGALVPALLEASAGSGRLYRAQDWRD